MTDLETLYQWEIDAADAGMGRHADVFRNARRYLALRDSRSYSGAMGDKWGLRMTAEPLSANEIRELDAAADRLLECGE